MGVGWPGRLLGGLVSRQVVGWVVYAFAESVPRALQVVGNALPVCDVGDNKADTNYGAGSTPSPCVEPTCMQ
jgi:hypothetical protein